MPNEKWIELDHELIKCRIKRIDNDCYRTLGVHSLPIKESNGSWWNYRNSSDNAQLNETPLAYFLASFELAYGPSENIYDSYKGAFSFPIAVKILQDNTAIAYLLNVTCWRGTVEFHFRKIIPANETRYDTNVIHQPFDDELSERQMHVLSNFLMGYAEGFWESVERSKDKLKKLFPEEENQHDFVKAIDSNGILFGYKDGQFFEMHYSDQDEYEQMKKELLIPYQQARQQKVFQQTFFDD